MARKQIDYETVQSDSIYELGRMVRAKLESGWRVAGGPVFASIGIGPVKRLWLQALVLEVGPDD